ncbi:MAG: D-alanyl-D-alanine carboxypeptidase [Tissierellia bacterium]|nr:D-alanyl-D-alanine carboxypeptidase [Tissierellia bacterium]
MGGRILKKKTIWLILIVIIFQFANPIYGEDSLDIKAESAILIDYHTGEILYEKNANAKLAPASISKIMTLLIGMEALESGKIKLTDNVRISKHAASMGGSQLWLEEGESQTVEALFKAIVLRSANDASVALAEHIAGSEEIFVNMMNEKAKALGMNNSNFTNASGLPHENNYVSAKDVSKMSQELLKHKKIHDWLTIYMDEMTVGKKKDKIAGLVNTNRLIKEYEGTTGIKTGSTQEAGFCLSASAKRGNLHLIGVIMGAKNSRIRFDESMRLLDYGFANYDSIPIGRKGDIFGKVPIHKGDIEYLEVVLERDAYILIPKEKGQDINKEIVLPEFIESPIAEGEKIGELIIKIHDKEIDRINLVSKNHIGKAKFNEMLKKVIKSLLINK